VVSDTGSMQAGSTASTSPTSRVQTGAQIKSGRIEDLAQPNTMLVFEGS